MATRVVAIVGAVMVTGCGQRVDSFSCTGDASCGVGGKCEPGFNLCSFADPDCGPDGRSFGSLAGDHHGQCVGSVPPPDGGTPPPDGGSNPPDGPPPDARTFCYGAAPFSICFASAPTGSIDINTATVFDTVNGTTSGITLACVPTISGATGYCVLAANTITISAPLRATGIAKPLVLLAVDSITTTAAGPIDVGSHRTPAESIGAGADPGGTTCGAGTPPATNNGTSGGGAGGSFTGAGGKGGNGADNAAGGAGGTGGTPAAAVNPVTIIRGGCPGQAGAGAAATNAGHGGGAVFLIAGNSITVAGAIVAGGEGGDGGAAADGGGGGGGAGGMIGFDAPTITANMNPLIVANGGGGGEGDGNAAQGNPGGDAVAKSAAPGGKMGSVNGGDGGDGAAVAAQSTGQIGKNGNNGQGGGGGGGGGGAGIIKGPANKLGNNVSPAATP